LLETLPPSRELALAYATLSHLSMMVTDAASTVLWGERALELAEQLHDTETICSALNCIGTSVLCSGDERGLAKVEAALQLAREHGYEEQVVRAYVNLAIVNLQHRNYAPATSYFQDGLAYCIDHDLEGWNPCWRQTGRWRVSSRGTGSRRRRLSPPY
jgi:hypothetical protein